MKKISFYLMMLFVAGLFTGCKEDVTTGPESAFKGRCGRGMV